MRKARLTLLFTPALLAKLAVAQTSLDSVSQLWCHYHRGTIRQVVDSGAKSIAPIVASGDVTTLDRVVLWRSGYQHVRTYLVYDGETKPLATNTAILLDSATKDTLWRRAYHIEGLFMEGENGFSLVISDTIYAALRRLAVPGELIWAFVTVHGLVPGPDPCWVSSLDEFGTAKEGPVWQKALNLCPAAE